MADEIVLFESGDEQVSLSVGFDGYTVWLSQAQMAELFNTTKQNVSLHVNNCFKEGELERVAAVKESLTTATDGKRYRTKLYNLDVVISVGYRVKSKRGVEFRRWATDVLRRYIVDGNAVNERRLRQLGQVAKVMARIPEQLETQQVLDIVQSYTIALDLLDDYDHQRIVLPEGGRATYRLTYDECARVIKSMKFGDESTLFGVEKDDSFKGSIGNIYQTFAGEDIYPSLEEKAANLLYFVTKNHSFLDGNKRIAATMFLYFLDRNNALFVGGRKVMDDSTIVAVTVMIAESEPNEKDAMVALVMNFLAMGLGGHEEGCTREDPL